ncbi:MAG: hypothetical protein V7704_05890 [Aurantimonas endophytica]|uniref:hypothetical protein n=1 Tax=Aurantimonas endophytica TaxID=1522175 RepID=UPI0030025A68
MSDDETPRPKTVGDLYDFNKASALLDSLFPRSTVEILQRLTGVPVRSVTRWVKGESRLPPTIQEKLRAQRNLQREFAKDLEDLLDTYAEKGALKAVLRAEILRTANDDWITEEEEI